MTTKTIERRKSDVPARPASGDETLRTVMPRADVWETSEAAHLVIELPGVSKDRLDVQIESDRLSLTATSQAPAVDGKTLREEWCPVRYARTFVLTDDADREGIEAQLRHGLLTIRVPRRAERRPRAISVNVSAD